MFVNAYNESDTTNNNNPLHEDGTGIVDITGVDGQEDVVIQSAASVNVTAGKILSADLALH